ERPVTEGARILELNERDTSVAVPMGRSGDTTVVETIADTSLADPEELLEEDDMALAQETVLGQLTDKQQEVLARRFGLRNHDPQTLEQVGREVGLTRERVRQIQVEALRRLRALMLRDGLDPGVVFGDRF